MRFLAYHGAAIGWAGLLIAWAVGVFESLLVLLVGIVVVLMVHGWIVKFHAHSVAHYLMLEIRTFIEGVVVAALVLLGLHITGHDLGPLFEPVSEYMDQLLGAEVADADAEE